MEPRSRQENELVTMVTRCDVDELLEAADKECDANKRLEALCKASELGQLECVKVLLDVGADPTARYAGRTALYWAVRANSIEIIQMMLEKAMFDNDILYELKGPHRSQKQNKVKMAATEALYEAAAHGQVESANALLDFGVDPNVYGYHDHAAVSWSTPLIAACYAYMGQRGPLERYSETAIRLVEQGADVTKASCYGETALHYAVYNKMPSDLILTMLRNGADVNSPNGTGKTPLTCVTDCIKTIDLLLKWGANINAGDKDGWTALHYAAAEGHVEIVSHLLANGADPNQIADHAIAPTTALALAIQSECASSREVVKLLVQWNSDVNILSYPQTVPDGTPFFMACFYTFDHIMADMLSLGGASKSVMRKCLDKPPFKQPMTSNDLAVPTAWQSLKDSFKDPCSLKHCCRLVIRNSIGMNIVLRHSLPLPPSLCDYLAMPELDDIIST